MKYKFIFSNIFLILISLQPVFALDFISDNKFNPTITKGYKIQEGDTFGGYPIFLQGGDWRIFNTFEGYSTTGTSRGFLPSVGMERYIDGKWAIGQWVTVNVGQGSGSGWEGNPCGGEKIIKINIMRGQLDRCATSEIKNIRIAAIPTDTLKLFFIETNNGGRYYSSTFNIHYSNLGITAREVTDPTSEFNLKLKEWMTKFLDATVRAASFDKPSDSFKNLTDVIEIFGNTRSSATAPKLNSSPPRGSTNTPSLQDRLRSLKDLFDQKLISEDEYNKKRKDLLNTL